MELKGLISKTYSATKTDRSYFMWYC